MEKLVQSVRNNPGSLSKWWSMMQIAPAWHVLDYSRLF